MTGARNIRAPVFLLLLFCLGGFFAASFLSTADASHRKEVLFPDETKPHNEKPPHLLVRGFCDLRVSYGRQKAGETGLFSRMNDIIRPCDTMRRKAGNYFSKAERSVA